MWSHDNDSVEEFVDADLDINLVEEIRDNSCGNLLRRRGGAKPTQSWPTPTLPRKPAPAFVAKESHVNLLRRRGGVTISGWKPQNTSSKMECYFAAIRPTNRLKE